MAVHKSFGKFEGVFEKYVFVLFIFLYINQSIIRFFGNE